MTYIIRNEGKNLVFCKKKMFINPHLHSVILYARIIFGAESRAKLVMEHRPSVEISKFQFIIFLHSNRSFHDDEVVSDNDSWIH